MSVTLPFIVAAVVVVFAIWSMAQRPASPPRLDLPYVCFDGQNPPQHYRAEYADILSRVYKKVYHFGLNVSLDELKEAASDIFLYYIKNGQAFCMRNPNDREQLVIMLPFKYLDEVKWAPGGRLSFWRYIDKV
ncbi:hypothetical protein MFIFM68171_06780 [Madurella fahalii]|uniref:Uncharacterized protein n=1 Tax=Madurella fahalii TaxID=1157608 RepID=A0ABQ0GFV2_9PEZI